jgi:hypothetical protein
MPGPTEDEIVRRTRLVPDDYRVFTVDGREALRIHRVGPDLLMRLVAAGLPHRRGADGPRFDQRDLENVGLALHLRTPRWTAMRSWRRCLASCPSTGPVRHTLVFKATCAITEPHACDPAVHPLAVAAADAGTVCRNADGFTLNVTTEAVDHRFPSAFADIAATVASLEFQVLPEQLAIDADFVVRSGLGDCASATMMLVKAGQEQGVHVRPAVGLLLAAPFPVWHQWIEVETPDGWRAADPFLLGVFARWGIVDPIQWPANRSPQGVLWRCHTAPFPLVTHDGQPLRVQIALTQAKAG